MTNSDAALPHALAPEIESSAAPQRFSWLYSPWLLGTLFLASSGHLASVALQHDATTLPWRLMVTEMLLLSLPGLLLYLRSRSVALSRSQWIWVIVVAGLARLFFLFPDPHLSDDCYRYIWDGRVQWAGFSPYGLAPNAAELDGVEVAWPEAQRVRHKVNHPSIPTIYPPVLQGAFVTVAALGGGLSLWRVLMLGVEALTVLLIAKGLSQRASQRTSSAAGGRSILLLYLWHPLPIFESVWSAHVEGIAVLFLLAAVVFWQGKHELRAATAMALGAAAKLLPLVLFPWLLRWRGWRPVLCCAAVGLCCLAIYWPENPQQALAGLSAYGKGWYFNDALFQGAGALFGIDVMDQTLEATQRLRQLLLVGFVLLTLLFSWRQKDPAKIALGVTLAFVLCSTTIYPWYLLWVLPFALLCQSAPALLLSYLVLLSNVVQVEWQEAGSWRVVGEVRLLEFVPPVILLLVLRWWHSRRPDRSELNSVAS